MSEIKLKNCPFCGGEAEISDEGLIGGHFVFCTQCHIQTKLYTVGNTTEKAINDWNTRKPMEEIVERLEDMYQPCYLCREDRCAIDRAIEIVKEVGGMNVE